LLQKEIDVNTQKFYRFFLSLFCLTLALMLAFGTANASPIQQTTTDFAAIDAYIEEQMDNLNIPGLALGIVEDGKIVHLQGFGVTGSSGEKVTPQTPFYLASVTKSFTALAVMQLVEAGKIDLDTPVQAYLPWFALADKDASARITVRHLLNQTSGISTTDGETDWFSQQSLEETVRGLDRLALSQPVGTTFQYSNLNYNIAGLVVEKVSRQSYADYVTTHIFEPLEMRHSHTSYTSARADGLAKGHYYIFGHAFEFGLSIPPAHLPSGFLISSAEDLSRYMIAQLNEGQYGDLSIISPQGNTEMHSPGVLMDNGNDSYALGWAVSNWDGIPIVQHSGSDGRYLSMISMLPESGTGVVLLSNANGFVEMPQIAMMSKAIVNLLHGGTPGPVRLFFSWKFLYWTIWLAPLVMILGIWYSRRWWRDGSTRHILIMVLFYGGIAALWLFAVSPVIGRPLWSAGRNIKPDLTYALLLGDVLGIGWSVIYTTMNLRSRRSKKRFS